MILELVVSVLVEQQLEVHADHYRVAVVHERNNHVVVLHFIVSTVVLGRTHGVVAPERCDDVGVERFRCRNLRRRFRELLVVGVLGE